MMARSTQLLAALVLVAVVVGAHAVVKKSPPKKAPKPPPSTKGKEIRIAWGPNIAKTVKAKCGDHLLIVWTDGYHDVTELNLKNPSAQYPLKYPDTCKTTNFNPINPKIGPANSKGYVRVPLTAAGARVFIDSQPGMCQQGYSVTVQVSGNCTASPPAFPTPPPKFAGK